MGGIMKWLKNKDSTMRIRRRESAPQQLYAKQTSEPAYREKIIRFSQVREHERIQRLSMGANDLAAYQSIAGDALFADINNTTPTDQNHFTNQPNTCPSKAYHKAQNSLNDRNKMLNSHNGHRAKKVSVQFHMAESTDESDLKYDNQHHHGQVRHSLPAMTSNAYARRMRRGTQNSFDSMTIREEAVEEFEDAHCTYDNSVNDENQTNYQSPPMKFYKPNSNPYTSNGDSSSMSTLCDTQPVRGKCPQKPKRLLANNQNSRRLLTEAHFLNHYNDFNNFEIRSPYYMDSSSMASTVDKPKHGSIDTDSYVNADQSKKYDVFVNKYGDTVEYALPCVELLEFQSRQQLPNCLTSDDSILANEVFQEDPSECVRILEENFERDISNASISVHEHMHDRHQNGRVMITDLDKSIESVHTLNDISTGRVNNLIKTPNQVTSYRETMQAIDLICDIGEFISLGKMDSDKRFPLKFEWGTFRSAKVTVRKTDFSDANEDIKQVAENAIISDAEVLRKIRHPNIITLMAIAFESEQRLALIIEPVKSTLHQALFIQNERLDLSKVVKILIRMARATSFLQECGLCHTNISSHAILVGESIADVKLSSFELAVKYQSDTEKEVLLKAKQMPKRPTIPKMASEQNIERYRQQETFHKHTFESNDILSFNRDINVKYLPYYTRYRRQLAIFNYQAPELLSQQEPFVFPTKQSDTYALALMLWELLNEQIPFQSYDEVTLVNLLEKSYPLKYLQIVKEERCQRFHDILEQGLKRKPDTRIDLQKMIQKLEAIQTEIEREYEKSQSKVKCCCLKMQKGILRQSGQDEETPEKSTSKQISLITSPPVVATLSTNSIENTLSPMNNVHRSILEFYQHLSPRRNTNEEARTSTLKKRRKMATPTKANRKRNARDLFGNDMANNSNDDTRAVTSQISEPLSTGRLSNEFNKAVLQSAISKDLELTNVEEVTPDAKYDRPAKKRIDQPFGPKESNEQNDIDAQQRNINNSSYQFVIDDYELPQELIARNNKIRRCTWLSSDQMNSSSLQCEPLSGASSNLRIKADDASVLPTLNENNDSVKKMNVSIKIVHKQMTPNHEHTQNDSINDCSMASTVSAASSNDSFSVKSRIKFFRSLESQPAQKPAANRSKLNISRRSEMSFNEARKAIEKAQRHTYPSQYAPQMVEHRLLQDISNLKADIENCLSKNKCLNQFHNEQINANETEQLLNNLLDADYDETNESVAIIIDDLLHQNSCDKKNAINESHHEESQKRNSVRETVQKLESSLRNNDGNNLSSQKIKNKLLNDKKFNADIKSDNTIHVKAISFGQNDKSQEVTDEKIEDVIHFVAPSEAENEAGPMHSVDETDETTTENKSQTLIKRTFYQESIIHGTNVEVPELKSLLVNSPTMTAAYSTTKRSSITTRVTLNMRKSRRRSSDVGSLVQQANDAPDEGPNSIQMADVRHSICGSPLPILGRTNSVDATSGRKLEQISQDKYKNHASGLMLSSEQLQSSICSNVLSGIFNAKQIQSIEDLYIDDDFGGINLAANMKLMTNSTDSLDNINFDILATHIFEQNSESTLTTTSTALNAIEDDAKADQ